MSDFDPKVTRKPRPEPVTFVCVPCGRRTEPDPWLSHSGIQIEQPPICAPCTRAFGRMQRPVGVTYGDTRHLQRLNAMHNALTWEIKNAPLGYSLAPQRAVQP